MGSERRKSKRVDLDIDFIVFSLAGEPDCVYLGRVSNVSADGMQIMLEDDVGAAQLLLGGRIVCERFPEALEIFGEDVPAQIAWKRCDSIGIRFLEPLGLSDEDIEEAVRAGGLPDWPDVSLEP